MFKKHTNLWIAHLRYAKNLRLRSAIYGYLALYGSLDKKKLFGMIVNKILEKIESTRGSI
ncbi:hypothetical protein M5D10_05535 [Leptospira santarosai]|uniref:hypothetical protein n=1 Tax=Leptospira santarosai TaxID=28183 RepID=UPI0022A92B95|nr:hypothetical protein [Leptospira santarosai]UZN08422.1 hypothetical protein M5D10_05535 [Leptospira santarosai]